MISQLEIETGGSFARYFASCVADEGGRHYRCTPNSSAVGLMNLTAVSAEDSFGNCSSPDDGCRRENLTKVDRWRFNTWQKLGGEWYSTPRSGLCAAGRRIGDGNCTWRVKRLLKTVDKQCADRGVFSVVEAHDRRGCFTNCPQPRNTSSACWTECFYETMLGPLAGDGLGDAFLRGGVPVSALEKAWLAPFGSSEPSRGGCPDLLAAR